MLTCISRVRIVAATMIVESDNKREPKRRVVRFPGICAAAAVRGVKRVSLFRALTGRWDLPKLVQRYEALQSAAPSSSLFQPLPAHLSREHESIHSA